MPSCSRATNPSGIEILFEEDSHTYSSLINNKKIIYTSGTTLVGQCFEPFDQEKIAPISARKLGISVSEVLERWKKSGEEASRFGTRCHEVCEDIILGNPVRNTPESEKEELVFRNAIKTAHSIRSKFEIIGVEKIVFDHNLKIAGTIDLLCRSKFQPNLYFIFDWKTNKEISRENKYGKTAKHPISHIPDTTLSHYQLQLNLYQYLLKFGKYVPANAIFSRVLFHLTPNGTEKIILDDLQSEIKDVLINHLVNIQYQ